MSSNSKRAAIEGRLSAHKEGEQAQEDRGGNWKALGNVDLPFDHVRV